MRFWFDTEFWEHIDQTGYHLDPISIGIVGEDGRELYLVNATFDWRAVPEGHWLRANVLPYLNSTPANTCTPAEMAQRITAFVGYERPEFWGYFADYDWVVLSQLYGSMLSLPKGWPMFCLDVQQWRYMINPRLRLPEMEGQAHNALDDARWTRTAWAYLFDLKSA